MRANILSREKLPMRRPSTFVIVAGMLALTLPGVSSAQTPGDAEQVSRLIGQLGSPRFTEREEAGRALDGLGPVALEALRRAADDRDPEIARRAAGVIRKIEKRQETTRMLAPLRVRLLYADTPLAAAVEDLAKKTGFAIKLEPDKALLLADRTLTLDTGEVTFWEAWERFCAAAGVMERLPAPPAGTPAPQTYGTSVVIINGNMRVVSSDVTRPESSDKEETLSLVPGKPRNLPTDRSGALRLTALPPETILVGQQKVDGEILFGLEATLEPRLKWLRALGLRVQRAVDDQGQTLSPRLVSFAKLASQRGNATMFVNGQPFYAEDAPPETNPRHLPIRLQRAEKPSHLLKELSGTLIALVQGPSEPLATIDNVFESAGQTVHGGGGSSLKVVEANRPENGEVRLRVYVESPPRGLDDGSFIPSTMVMVVNGRRIGNDTEEPLSGLNFALYDQKGKRVPTLRAQTTGKRSGAAREYELSYQVDEGVEPSRFVFIGRRTAVVEVPFTLHDVPLP
jgi:hypothetical protein